MAAVAVGENSTEIHSIDGGENWMLTDAHPGSVDLSSIYFSRPDRLLALGHMGEIHLSKDGGRSWQNKVSGTDVTLRALAFLTQKEVVAVGDGGISAELRPPSFER